MKNHIEQYQLALISFKKEVESFSNEIDIWKTLPGISNSCANLSLHLIGNLNHFIGAQMGNTGYVRQREKEFSEQTCLCKDLIFEIDQLIKLIPEILNSKNQQWLSSNFPTEFIGQIRTNEFMLVYLLGHLNYHLGQINYLRRILENRN